MVGQKHGGMSFEEVARWMGKNCQELFSTGVSQSCCQTVHDLLVSFSGHESNVKHMDQISKLAVSTEYVFLLVENEAGRTSVATNRDY